MASTTLYRLYSKAGLLLYVGISTQPGYRLSVHRHEKPWWYLVERYTLEEFADWDDAARAEHEAIKHEWPLCNRQAHPNPDWVQVVTEEPSLLALAEDIVAAARMGAEFGSFKSGIDLRVGWGRMEPGPAWLFDSPAHTLVIRVLESLWDSAWQAA